MMAAVYRKPKPELNPIFGFSRASAIQTVIA
jgi:hypothetical protein